MIRTALYLPAAVLALTSYAGAENARFVDCRHARPKQACTIVVDARTKTAPGPTKVVSGTEVTLLVLDKPPLVPVKFKMSRAAADPPESPFSALLTLASGAGVPAALARIVQPASAAVATLETRTQAAVESAKSTATAPDPGPQLLVLAGRVKSASEKLSLLTKRYVDLEKGAGDLAGCEADNADVDRCRESVSDTVGRIQAVIGEGIPILSDHTEALKAIDRKILEQNLLGNVELLNTRDTVAAAIQAQQFAVEKLKRSQKELDELAASLRNAAARATREARFDVPRDRNTTTTIEVTFPPDSNPIVVPVVVQFQDWAWVSASVGIAITAFQRNSYAAAQHFDPTITDPAKQTYARIQHSITTRQIVPISFVNLQAPFLTARCFGRDVGLTASVGVGVNVGTQKAEFAAGPGLRIGRAQFVVGAHWARSASLINGFTVDQVVDASLVPPVNEPYVRHWSVAITYRLK
jgi:hypothetical protein